MAPSNMFSYLRPGHAKRNASSLASPEPAPSPAAVPLPSPSQSTEYFISPRFSDHASHVSSSPISPYPPQLPPINRVASKLESPQPRAAESNSQPRHAPSMLSPPQRTQDQPSPSFESPVSAARPATASALPAPRPQRLEPPPQSPAHLSPTVISPSYLTYSKSQTSLIGGISEKLSGSSKNVSMPTAVPAKGKSRLNLRNPMSLLMRRRSGQTLDPLADEALVSHRSPASGPSVPDDFDPSIRGHIVHDFNAPRLNRNFSYNNAYSEDQSQSQQPVGRVSPQKIEREHTPVFREHFDDDTSYEQSQAAIRAEQLVNKDFLARNSVQFSPPERSPPPPPPIAKDSPPSLSPPASTPPPRTSFSAADSILSPVLESDDALDVSTEATPRKRKSIKTPPPARSRATSVTDPSFQPAGLPAHFTSRASRFSFQISSSTDSAQEAMLEERHKKKAAEKASKQSRISTNTIDDEYDEYDMDEYDMDGGFEEEIPMLGDEDDFGGLGDQSMDAGINTFDFSNLSLQQTFNGSLSPIIAQGQLQTPLDANGNTIGFAMSGDMLQHLEQPASGNGFGDHIAGGDEEVDKAAPESAANGQQSLNLDDDIYFDDGLIGDQDDLDATAFDESVFDDPDGPLYDRKMKLPPPDEGPYPLSFNPAGALSSETGYDADDDTMNRPLDASAPSLAHKNSVARQRVVPDFDNMDAYHSALADAATRAEAEGRFARKASVDVGGSNSDAENPSSLSNSRPSLVPDDGRFSMETENYLQDDDVFGMSSSFVDDYDYSDFESGMEDDPMIAAANAEALAFDDEGFYGQEFGFYASAVGDSPNAWGGFFGPSGLGRTVSGRNAVREPNLTPITERSEYSTRNSFISLNHFRDSQQAITSPGLAQLARMSPYGWPEEEDMSLDTLLKLRKGAFGSSAASLPGSTSNSPRNSSPMGMQFVPRMSSPAGNRMREHSGSELESDESANVADGFAGDEDDEALTDAVNGVYEDEEHSDASGGNEHWESPTLTASDYNSLSSPDGRSTKKLPALPPNAQLQALHSMQSPPSSSTLLPLDGFKSPSSVPLPMSPYGIPLASPFVPQQRAPGPPSIDTSLSSPSATVSTSTGPRRQSMVSPISNASPITPGGSGWRGGHSRKTSAADSVTYVRDHDEAGESRWILERRRTAESGELELVGREIVEGGRI